MKITTQKFLILWAALALFWEGYTLVDKTPRNTISETVWGWARHLFIVRFGVAFLFAHLFFQRDEGAKDDALWRLVKRYPVCATFLGLASGYLCWQRAPELAHSQTTGQ